MDVVQHTNYATEAFFPISFRAMDLLTNYVPFVPSPELGSPGCLHRSTARFLDTVLSQLYRGKPSSRASLRNRFSSPRRPGVSDGRCASIAAVARRK